MKVKFNTLRNRSTNESMELFATMRSIDFAKLLAGGVLVGTIFVLSGVRCFKDGAIIANNETYAALKTLDVIEDFGVE